MTSRSLRRLAPVLGLALLLPGCAALSALGDASEPLQVYELRAPDGIAGARRTVQRDVIVELPTTSGALATDRIMIRPTPLQAQYLPGVRWSEATPEMVQTLMLRSLDASGGLRYVGRRPLAARGDFAIVTELTDFQADARTDPETGQDGATVRLRFLSRLVREENAAIVASRSFDAVVPVASLDTGALIAGFDAAAAGVMPDFADWVLAAVGGR